ncbi:xanthine dehydrogenase family protein subunit M [Mariniluteicoccus endophyticus]
MRPFDYQRADTVDEALALAGDDAVFLSGGTNLVDHLRLGVATPARVVDIGRLDLGGIDETEGGVRVGANVRNSDLAADPTVRTRFPFVSEALLAGASGQLRNMASTAGNLLQRTRCVYFQDVTTPCNKREPGTGCSAREGYGTYNAVLGASEHCVAVHPSDLCVPLAALDTVVHVVGRDGARDVPFGDFHRLPGDEPQRDTTLAPGELVTGITIAGPDWVRRSTYRKVRERASYAFATVSVAAALDLDGDRVRDVRLAFGGVAHRPHRATTAEGLLRGGPATADAFRAAAEAELEPARTGPENAYKIPQLTNTVVAVLERLAGQETR